ncbi:MAG: hypothetical protein ABSE57_13980 [Bryobacteraceae bacterium]|jgi:hypothetical protein
MARQALVILLVVIAFGILVPIYKGFAFLDPRIILAYACLALLFVAPASAELATTNSAGLLGRIAIIIAWGWGVTVLILATALVTLNVMTRGGGFIAPPLLFLAAILVFSLSSSIAVAMLGAILARRFSAAQVKTILRTAFLVILLGLAFGSRFLPENVTLAIGDRFNTRRALTHLAWESSAVCGAIAALLLLVQWKTRPEGPFAKIPMAENPNEGGG